MPRLHRREVHIPMVNHDLRIDCNTTPIRQSTKSALSPRRLGEPMPSLPVSPTKEQLEKYVFNRKTEIDSGLFSPDYYQRLEDRRDRFLNLQGSQPEEFREVKGIKNRDKDITLAEYLADPIFECRDSKDHNWDDSAPDVKRRQPTKDIVYDHRLFRQLVESGYFSQSPCETQDGVRRALNFEDVSDRNYGSSENRHYTSRVSDDGFCDSDITKQKKDLADIGKHLFSKTLCQGG